MTGGEAAGTIAKNGESEAPPVCGRTRVAIARTGGSPRPEAEVSRHSGAANEAWHLGPTLYEAVYDGGVNGPEAQDKSHNFFTNNCHHWKGRATNKCSRKSGNY